jgi:hypothetical protein
MKFKRNELLKDLKKDTQKAIAEAENFKKLTETDLNFKRNTESWSILECLEHLNLYGDFYLVEIEKQILNTNETPNATIFKSGVLGNYFANSMQPKPDGSISNKMKTFKDKNPTNSTLSITTIDRFIKQQQQMLTLLDAAKKVDLRKIKTRTTLPILKFRLGDTLRFVIYHVNRHLVQAHKVNVK